MSVLGLHRDPWHNSGAAAVSDASGTLRFANLADERLDRVKDSRNFPEKSILVVDGRGSEKETQSLFYADRSGITLLDKTSKIGIGLMYAAVTHHIDFGLLQSGLFEDIFINPAASDTGIPLGCALYGYHYCLVMFYSLRIPDVCLALTNHEIQ